MILEKEHLEQIGNYVKSHLEEWLDDRSSRYSRSYEMELRERTIRIEDELKNQRELMKLGFEQVDKRFELVEKRFEQVDKRFEQVDKRFDDVNKRFSQLMWMMGLGFTLITTVISILATHAK